MKLSEIPRHALAVLADFVRAEPLIVGGAATAAATLVTVNLGLPAFYGGVVSGSVLASGAYITRNFVTPAGSIEDNAAKAVAELIFRNQEAAKQAPAPAALVEAKLTPVDELLADAPAVAAASPAQATGDAAQ